MLAQPEQKRVEKFLFKQFLFNHFQTIFFTALIFKLREKEKGAEK